MKRVFKFMLVAAVASLALVSCKKNNQPNKEKEKENEEQEDPNKEKEVDEAIVLAVDGKFGEWASIAAVEGEGAILLTKAQADDKKLYFYLEADVALMENEKFAFANYLHLYIDCGGDGMGSVSHWGGEEGSSYDALYQIWLMTNGSTTMANWDTGFSGKGKIEDGVYRAEIAFDRSANEAFKSKTVWYGLYLTDAFCDTSSGSEEWGGGEFSGAAPALGADMAKVKQN
ncbi:MAG: hypothetical protein II171_01600 [Bacteroidales bacterium]|nr:hypothetical protein [Bacteroidales bacterium]